MRILNFTFTIFILIFGWVSKACLFGFVNERLNFDSQKNWQNVNNTKKGYVANGSVSHIIVEYENMVFLKFNRSFVKENETIVICFEFENGDDN